MAPGPCGVVFARQGHLRRTRAFGEICQGGQTLQTVKTLQTVRAGQTVFAIMTECRLTARPNCRAGGLRPRYVPGSARVNGSHRRDCPRWPNWPVNTGWRGARSFPRSGVWRLTGLYRLCAIGAHSGRDRPPGWRLPARATRLLTIAVVGPVSWLISQPASPDPTCARAPDAAAGSQASVSLTLGAVAVGVLPVTSMSGALVSRGGALTARPRFNSVNPGGPARQGVRATMTWDASGLLRVPRECATMGRQYRHCAQKVKSVARKVKEPVAAVKASAMSKFAHQLRGWRAKQGWSQAELAGQLGYSSALVSQVEQEHKPPSAEFAAKCDEVFGTPATFADFQELVAREA